MVENKDFDIEVAPAKPFDQGAPRINGPSVDSFTMALFTNEELLDINQDELGKGPEIAFSKGDTRIYVRPLANGDYAAAFANIEDKPKKLELKRPGKTLIVRDVLAQGSW